MSSSTNKLACTYSLIPRKNAAQITPAWSGPTVSSPVTTMHNLSALNKLWVNSIYESNITSLKSQTSSSINRGKRFGIWRKAVAMPQRSDCVLIWPGHWASGWGQTIYPPSSFIFQSTERGYVTVCNGVRGFNKCQWAHDYPFSWNAICKIPGAVLLIVQVPNIWFKSLIKAIFLIFQGHFTWQITPA